MRVVHLIKAKQIGGAERHLLMLLPALRARDIDARLLVMVEPEKPMHDLIREARDRDVPVERVPIKRNTDLLIINRIRRQLVDLKPDILHTHLIHADTFGLTAGKLARVPFIITSRHNDDEFRRRTAVKLASSVLWNGFAGCITISEAVRDFVQNVEGAPADKLQIIRYGIEHQSVPQAEIEQARADLLASLALPDDAVILGMACRLVEQKGVSYALQALAQLKDCYPQAHLVIAGDGDLLHDLKHEAGMLEIADQVHFLGWRTDVPELMKAFDLFLMPSLWEGFGLVALEAMSKRVPVIASAVSALPEVVADQQSGLLIPPHDPDALAQAIATLLADRPRRRHMGILAEDRVEREFAVGRMADETVAFYRQFVPEQPSTTGTAKKRVPIG